MKTVGCCNNQLRRTSQTLKELTECFHFCCQWFQSLFSPKQDETDKTRLLIHQARKALDSGLGGGWRSFVSIKQEMMEETKQWDGWSAGSDRQGGGRKKEEGAEHKTTAKRRFSSPLLTLHLSLSLSFIVIGRKKLRKNPNKELGERRNEGGTKRRISG